MDFHLTQNEIATSPFVYWGVAVFMPEKLGNLQVNDFNEGGGKRRWINVSQQPVHRNDEIKEAICLNDWREVSVIDKRRPN